jgi:hypothetical protein
LADLREFDEADHTYRLALRGYQDVSPFAVAWVCFQLGVLWGELVPQSDSALAERWYRRAITCLPCYVKARVHLAEIYSSCGRISDAEAALALASGDRKFAGGWAATEQQASMPGCCHLRPAIKFEEILKSICWHLQTMARNFRGSGDPCVPLNYHALT